MVEVEVFEAASLLLSEIDEADILVDLAELTGVRISVGGEETEPLAVAIRPSPVLLRHPPYAPSHQPFTERSWRPARARTACDELLLVAILWSEERCGELVRQAHQAGAGEQVAAPRPRVERGAGPSSPEEASLGGSP